MKISAYVTASLSGPNSQLPSTVSQFTASSIQPPTTWRTVLVMVTVLPDAVGCSVSDTVVGNSIAGPHATRQIIRVSRIAAAETIQTVLGDAAPMDRPAGIEPASGRVSSACAMVVLPYCPNWYATWL